VLPVRYELNSHRLLRTYLVFKGLNVIKQCQIRKKYFFIVGDAVSNCVMGKKVNDFSCAFISIVTASRKPQVIYNL
jgi:hypothetical protein